MKENKVLKPAKLINIRKNNKLKHEAINDATKGNAKPLLKDRTYVTLHRDDTKVRTVQLDNKTTKLLYPGQSGYDKPIDILRQEWAIKQQEGLKMLKGA